MSKWLARFSLTLMGTPPSVLPWTTQKTTIVPAVAVPGIATTAHVITPVGPGLLNPVIINGLIQLYTELSLPNAGQSITSPFGGAPFNSGDVFVNFGNEIPKIQTNNFKTGNVKPIKNNTWSLPDKYYRAV